jgi:hypothetical protein
MGEGEKEVLCNLLRLSVDWKWCDCKEIIMRDEICSGGGSSWSGIYVWWSGIVELLERCE